MLVLLSVCLCWCHCRVTLHRAGAGCCFRVLLCALCAMDGSCCRCRRCQSGVCALERAYALCWCRCKVLPSKFFIFFVLWSLVASAAARCCCQSAVCAFGALLLLPPAARCCCLRFGAWFLVPLQGAAGRLCCQRAVCTLAWSAAGCCSWSVMCALEPACWCRWRVWVQGTTVKGRGRTRSRFFFLPGGGSGLLL